MTSSSDTDNLAALDRDVAIIERGSRDPFGGRYHTRPLIDTEILARFADPDEMEHEAEIDRTYRREFPRGDAVEDGSTIDPSLPSGHSDFRDHLDILDCDCRDGETCQVCCTDLDLRSFPISPMIKVRSMSHHHPQIKDFLVIMPIELAVDLGLIDYFDVPSRP